MLVRNKHVTKKIKKNAHLNSIVRHARICQRETLEDRVGFEALKQLVKFLDGDVLRSACTFHGHISSTKQQVKNYSNVVPVELFQIWVILADLLNRRLHIGVVVRFGRHKFRHVSFRDAYKE